MKVKLRLSSLVLLMAVIGLWLTSAVIAQQDGSQPSAALPTPTPTISSPQTSPPDERLNQIEKQLGELSEKVEVRPKDFWDKLSALSTVISGVIIGFITAVATLMYKQREIRLLQVKHESDDKDKKAKLQLEQLANERAQTQLKSDEVNKEREIVIAQAQTIRELIPYLQSEDERPKATALMLIAYLGNPELATKLSGLYETNNANSVASVLNAIASMPGAKIEERRQAAMALFRFGRNREAVDKLLELASEHNATGRERMSIAEEVKKLDEPQRAAHIYLAISSDPQLVVTERYEAIEALKQLQFVEQATQHFEGIAENNEADIKNRVVAIDALAQLDNTHRAAIKTSSVLVSIIRSAQAEASDLHAAFGVLKKLRLASLAAGTLRQIAFNGKGELLKRFESIEILRREQLQYDGEATAKREEILREAVQNPEVNAELSIVAIKELGQQISKEEAAGLLRKIIDSTQPNRETKLSAVSLLEELGYTEEARQKRETLNFNFLSRIKTFFRPESA